MEGILDGVEDISFCRLTGTDVVRHRLVGRIVEAYDAFDAEHHDRASGAPAGAVRPRPHSERGPR